MNQTQKTLAALIFDLYTPAGEVRLEAPQKGTLVSHCGHRNTSKRVGWKGIVASHNECASPNPIIVHWFCYEDGLLLEEVHVQAYSLKWAEVNLRYDTAVIMRRELYLAFQSYLLDVRVTSHLEESVVKKKAKAMFILWSPDGRSNPKRVHGTYEKALEVAEHMSNKHRQTFHVCKAVSSVVTSVTEVLTTKVEVL